MMSDAVFDIRLTRTRVDTAGTSRLSAENYSDDLDSVASIHADICEAIQQERAAEFIVSGFGEDRWPVDVHTDLLTILEQLPDATAALSEHRQFLLDFYEQGIGGIKGVRTGVFSLARWWAKLMFSRGLDFVPFWFCLPRDGVVGS